MPLAFYCAGLKAVRDLSESEWFLHNTLFVGFFLRCLLPYASADFCACVTHVEEFLGCKYPGLLYLPTGKHGDKSVEAGMFAVGNNIQCTKYVTPRKGFPLKTSIVLDSWLHLVT